MTEFEFQSTDDPETLLESLRGVASSAQFRLFAVACCRRIWQHLTEECRLEIQVAEEFANGVLADEVRKQSYVLVNSICIYVDSHSSPTDRLQGFAGEAALNCVFGDGDYPPIPTYAATCAIAAASAVVEVVSADCEIQGESEATCETVISRERRWQCNLIRSLFL